MEPETLLHERHFFVKQLIHIYDAYTMMESFWKEKKNTFESWNILKA